MMAVSNYDTALEQARLLFLTYDRSALAEKFSLATEGDTVFIPFVGRTYRLSLSDGRITDECGRSADYNTAMSIYDVLCWSKPLCRTCGNFAPINSVARAFHSSGLGESLTDRHALYFSKAPHLLERACIALGGTKDSKGDVAYRLDVFPFLPVLLRFWQADDEFPASLQLLWDTNTLDFVHYETTYYIAGHLIARLRELTEQV